MSKYYIVYKNGCKLKRIFSNFKKEEFDNVEDCYKRYNKLLCDFNYRELNVYKDGNIISITDLISLNFEQNLKKQEEKIEKENNNKKDANNFTFKVYYNNKVIFKLYINKVSLKTRVDNIHHEDITRACLLDETFYTEYILFNESISLLCMFNNIDDIGCYIYEVFKGCLDKGTIRIDYF